MKEITEIFEEKQNLILHKFLQDMKICSKVLNKPELRNCLLSLQFNQSFEKETVKPEDLTLLLSSIGLVQKDHLSYHFTHPQSWNSVDKILSYFSAPPLNLEIHLDSFKVEDHKGLIRKIVEHPQFSLHGFYFENMGLNLENGDIVLDKSQIQYIREIEYVARNFLKSKKIKVKSLNSGIGAERDLSDLKKLNGVMEMSNLIIVEDLEAEWIKVSLSTEKEHQTISELKINSEEQLRFFRNVLNLQQSSSLIFPEINSDLDHINISLASTSSLKLLKIFPISHDEDLSLKSIFKILNLESSPRIEICNSQSSNLINTYKSNFPKLSLKYITKFWETDALSDDISSEGFKYTKLSTSHKTLISTIPLPRAQPTSFSFLIHNSSQSSVFIGLSTKEKLKYPTFLGNSPDSWSQRVSIGKEEFEYKFHSGE